MADALTEILQAARKHPNSRVSKLIHTVEEEPSQKNIVLLLIELSEHAEYSTDFNVSLKYYLDLFEQLGINCDLVLNEAGLLLLNSSKIYAKRVDYVQSLVERQILTLSNADDELQKQNLEKQQTENACPIEKPKRGRKRALEVPSDPYEVELAPKKFKKLTEEKRFAVIKTVSKAKSIHRFIEMEQYIHPSGWLHATIYDLENDEDVDTKRNYKLFTYHVEHRYNTLVPDINFRLHFKVKDYIDAQEEMEEDEACSTDRSWPPLSEAYVQKYLRLENFVLQQDLKDNSSENTVIAKNAERAYSLYLENNINDSNTNELRYGENDLECDQNLVNASLQNVSTVDKFRVNFDDTTINANNDSGLDRSILDETNNTLSLTQLNSTNLDLLNDSEKTENKSINETEIHLENDSALGTSVLEKTINTTLEICEDLNNATNVESLKDTSAAEVNQSLNVTGSQQENDSALGTSILEKTIDTTVETCDDLHIETNAESLKDTSAAEVNQSFNEKNESLQSTKDTHFAVANQTLIEMKHQYENDKSVLDQISNTDNNSTLESNGYLNTTEKSEETISKEDKKIEVEHQEGLVNTTESRRDSALSEDLHRHAISIENIPLYRDKLNDNELKEKNLDLDVAQLHDKDDEGVCLSDVDEQDHRLLSPIIKMTNILPGVESKDITILMDDELRQAFEMRDNIMEHFSYETYKVPVITQPQKHNLLFNIFQLPEKILRRKVLFKLGPEMGLYLQARSLKRCRPEPVTRVYRLSPQLMQWFSLNNTDMSGVCMTPPSSPGHCSDFCGFSDADDEDTTSSIEFTGFTEDEQKKLTVEQISRLSRDSGVGVDGNNITPEKEILDIIFEKVTKSIADSCKINIDEELENQEQSTENILNQLPADIREVLTIELEENTESNTPEKEDNRKEDCKVSEKKSDSSSAEENEKNNTTTLNVNKKPTRDTCSTKDEYLVESNNAKQDEKIVTLEDISTEYSVPNSNQESIILLTEASTKTNDALKLSEDNIESTECVATKESQDKPSDIVTNNKVTSTLDIINTVLEMPNKTPTLEENCKSGEELLKEKLDLANCIDQNDCNEDHQADISIDDSENDGILDLNTQGTKTKIQKWHEHLQPILAKSRERHHFDVFQLGTEIIDKVQNRKNSNNETLNVFKTTPDLPGRHLTSFHDIMDNKDKSYVSRYFLSTLLLANQSNIEISIDNKSSDNPTSWQDINLKLLSTKRHTVAIEDNIGIIDNKMKAGDKNLKQNQNKRKLTEKEIEDADDEKPLVKLEESKKSPKKSKTSLKRSYNNVTKSNVAEKRLKEEMATINSQHNKLPNFIQNVQILTPSYAISPTVATDIMIMPSTSCQTPSHNNALQFNANMNTVRTLQPIEKVHKRCDDYDSGIFSIDEMSTS